MNLLEGQIILITGASRGLGRALAEETAMQGAHVIVNYLSNESAAIQTVNRIERQGGRALAVRADITAEQEVEEMFTSISRNFGKLHGVINNALPSYRFDAAERQAFADLPWQSFLAQLDGTLGGTYRIVRQALPLLKESRGSVLNILSNLITHPVVPYHDYIAAKAALLGLTRSLSSELGPYGIRVNALAPGLLQTTDASSATSDEVFELIAGSTPLRSVTTPAQAAKAALPFLSPWFAAVTGQYLAVDGGLTMP